MRKVVEGKRVVMIDDSIVRGTTSLRIVNLLREAGATEVHVRITSPPFANPCFYGIDTPDREGPDRVAEDGGGDPAGDQRGFAAFSLEGRLIEAVVGRVGAGAAVAVGAGVGCGTSLAPVRPEPAVFRICRAWI